MSHASLTRSLITILIFSVFILTSLVPSVTSAAHTVTQSSKSIEQQLKSLEQEVQKLQAQQLKKPNRQRTVQEATTTAIAKLTLTVTPTTTVQGQPVTLTWSSENVTACVADSSWQGAKASSGTESIVPTAKYTTYRLICKDTIKTSPATKVAIVSTIVTDMPNPRDPELPRVYVDSQMPNQTSGNTITVNAGGDLQKALNSAVPGDTIVLEAGATFKGNFVLPNKPNPSNKWIIIKSSKMDLLPAEGNRVFPQDAVNMPKIIANSVSAAITAAPSSNYYRIMGVEVVDDGMPNIYGPTLDPIKYPGCLKATDGKCHGAFSYGLINLGVGGSTQTLLSHMPHHIVIDRSYIHGNPTTHVKYGVSMNGAHLAAVDSYFSEFHGVGQDTQAINGYNGTGPVKIVNNFLQGAGENVIFGGASPFIDGLVTADIEIRGNHFHKNTAWMINDPNNPIPYKLNPNYVGIRWLVKNHFELKQGVRVLFEGNILENHWADGQDFAILFQGMNQNQTTQGRNTTVQDVTLRKNIIKGAPRGANLAGLVTAPGVKSGNYLLEDNIFMDLHPAKWTNYNDGGCCAGIFQVLQDADNVTIRHNTGFQKGGNFVSAESLVPMNNLNVSDNFVNYGAYGFGANPVSIPNAKIIKNLVVGTALPSTSYPNNLNASTLTAVGVKNTSLLEAADHELLPTSPFKGKASDGRDPGADIAKVLDATKRTLSGGRDSAPLPPPPPPPPPPIPASIPTLTLNSTPTTITWNSTNATACTASGGWTGSKSTSGTQTISPTVTTTYTLTCTGTGGSVTKATMVTIVTTPPAIPATAPTLTLSNTQSSITWSSTSTTACTASGGWTGTKAISGTETIAPTQTTTYTLLCVGSGGSVTKSATVTIAPRPATTPPPKPTPVVTPPPVIEEPRSSGGGGGDGSIKSKTPTPERYTITAPILRVRSAPGITAPSLGIQQAGTEGTLKEPPVTKDGYTWYHLNYDRGIDGWSTGLYLKKITSTETKTINTTKTSKSCTTKAKYTKSTNVFITKAKTPVRVTPNGTVLKTKKLNAQGTITKDPTCTDTTVWYYVDFKSGTDGYVRETRLKKG